MNRTQVRRLKMIDAALGLPRQQPRRLGRSAYSLMEIFLVIAILSAVTMLVLPSLSKPLNQSVAQEAGQSLLKELAAARSEAIESGHAILFQFLPGTGRYYLGSNDQRQTNNSDDRDQVSNQARAAYESEKRQSRDLSTSSREPSGRMNFLDSRIRELPGSVSFADPAELESGDESLSDGEMLPVPDPSRAGIDSDEKKHASTSPLDRAEPAKWTSPIRFYPSGKLMPARIVLRSENGSSVEIEIQRLAGRMRLHGPK